MKDFPRVRKTVELDSIYLDNKGDEATLSPLFTIIHIIFVEWFFLLSQNTRIPLLIPADETISNESILDLEKSSTCLAFTIQNELEFYYQVIHCYAEIKNKPIYIKLKIDEQIWVIPIRCVSYIPR